MSKKKKRRMHARAVRKNKLAMLSITFVVCMLFGVLLYNGNKLEQRIEEKNIEIDTLNAKIADEKQRTQEIYELEAEMQTDEYIASVAQNKLGLVKEDEIILKAK